MQLTNLQQKIPLGRQQVDRDYNRDQTEIHTDTTTAIEQRKPDRGVTFRLILL